jgi:hypothetical protein
MVADAHSEPKVNSEHYKQRQSRYLTCPSLYLHANEGETLDLSYRNCYRN